MIKDLKAQLDRSIQTMQRFLQRPVSVKQGTLTIGVTASSLRKQAREQERQRVHRMRRDLFDLMQQHPGSRRLMRHLDMLERTLRKKGYAAVEVLPVGVVTKALAQLESLVRDWTPTGLAELRSRLAVMVKTRQSEAQQEAASTAAAELDMATQHSSADVSEVDHATFEAMERSWIGEMPPDAAAAQAAAKG